MDETGYNKVIYCYVEEQKDALNKLISRYNEGNAIHIISSVVESCEGNILYCLCDIITNYIDENKKQEPEILFVTDIKTLYNIVDSLYSYIFKDIIYINQDNVKEFNNGLDIDEFINYFLNIQRSKLHASFMRRFWKLKNCIKPNDFIEFLYELGQLDIENKKDIVRLWCCFCKILLHEPRYNKLEKDNFIYRLSIYSVLMILDKKADYTNMYLSEILKNDKVKPENMYFIYQQFKRTSFIKQAVMDKKSNSMINELYDKSYNSYIDNYKKYFNKIPYTERDKNLVMVMTVQFLNATHAPTQTIIERIKVLLSLGKKIVLINTTEFCLINGYLPLYGINSGTVWKGYNDIREITVGENVIPFLQIPDDLVISYRLQMLVSIINKFKPYYILSIGNGSILADLCGNIIPCAAMSIVFSSVPQTKNKMKILGRKINGKEKELYKNDDIIESRFTFELKQQKKHYSRKDKNLPKNAFILVIVGTRLQFDITNDFMEMLTKACNAGCYVVFAGIMDNYKSLMEDYPVVSANSLFTGYCDDILALMEICDLYVNPKRLGGGFSVIEAFAKGKPGVYLKSGDVYTAGGEDFAVNDFDEMSEKILQYKNDKDYYNKMSGLAKERAKLMTSSTEAIEDIDRQICQRIEAKYW